ncbi:MAG TPA: PQQ-dependent sugar dehydrogenase [Bacteroidales bacterium]|nr:PQQ-dependent sugar dehydrogenase [Bacteroidales bacterium]
MKLFRYILTGILFLFFLGARSQPFVGLKLLASGFNFPVCIANAGDGRLFVVEQPGRILIIDSTGAVLPTPFLDIRGRVVYGGERGLLGVAFHPLYLANGYFFVDYVGAGDSTHISRFSVSQADPDIADSNSEVKLMTIYQPYQNHNGGDVNFGPDGYLYIGMGDGGSAGDPENRAQDSLQLLGKILRIDVDGGSPYSIPSTNPFVGNPNARPEIWALGVRNPWRFSFDRITGDLWIADVGQDTWEEVDFQPANSPGGQNYGWRCYEGLATYNTTGCHPYADFTFPVHVYHHSTDNGCSITGGYRYRGSLFPNMTGHYFFADYCSDNIWSLYDSAGGWGTLFHGKYAGNGFSAFGEDRHGELYLAGVTSGNVYRVVDTTELSVGRIQPAEVSIFPDPFYGPVYINTGEQGSEPVQFSISDLQGTVRYAGTLSGAETGLDLSNLPPGLYILRMESDKGVRFGKLVKR